MNFRPFQLRLDLSRSKKTIKQRNKIPFATNLIALRHLFRAAEFYYLLVVESGCFVHEVLSLFVVEVESS